MRGFAGERISVLARPLMREALTLPLTSRLLVTDRGYFPKAADHQQAQQYLREHVGARTSVVALAALAQLGPSHFAALFRRATGTGVLRYQTRPRMSRARELLDTTDQPIAEIARTLGYTDPFYFSRQFRAVHGTSPSDYRGQHKG
jgi:AraC-like DNA-binding protein